MRDLELGRVVRALRHRRGWRQTDAAGRARVHRSTWSRLERGQLDGMSVGVLRGCLAGLGVRLEMLPRLRGAELDRLVDEAHAALQSTWAARLARWQWTRPSRGQLQPLRGAGPGRPPRVASAHRRVGDRRGEDGPRERAGDAGSPGHEGAVGGGHRSRGRPARAHARGSAAGIRGIDDRAAPGRAYRTALFALRAARKAGHHLAPAAGRTPLRDAHLLSRSWSARKRRGTGANQAARAQLSVGETVARRLDALHGT